MAAKVGILSRVTAYLKKKYAIVLYTGLNSHRFLVIHRALSAGCRRGPRNDNNASGYTNGKIN